MYISSLKCSDGTLAWNHEKEAVLHDYFSGVLGTKVRCSRSFNWTRLDMSTIQGTPRFELDRPFSEEEVEYAVKCLPNDKTQALTVSPTISTSTASQSSSTTS